jgi:UTP--glucose-1-phosphate uridylyltransferase
VIAVVPAAGRGTRMVALTGGKAKELLPWRGKLLLDAVIDEAKDAGVPDIVVVGSPFKEEVLALAATSGARTVVQIHPDGLAFAVALAARRLPALVLLPDVVYDGGSPSRRLVAAMSRGYDIAIAVAPVSDDEVGSYGIVEWSPETGRVSRVLEKPDPSETNSRWAVASRFAFSARATDLLQRFLEARPKGEDLSLSPFISEAIERGLTAVAEPLLSGERRWDCGTPEGYAKALEEA